MISVIVPTLNEAGTLPRLLGRCRPASEMEVVVSDGGSEDGTPDTAERLGARVVRSGRGRGRQMNAGARVARGDVLLFVHADAEPPHCLQADIASILGRPGVVAGAWLLSIDAAGASYRMIERLANLRSRVFQLPYGDQGFFIRRADFDFLGGFSDAPIMEDVEMVRRCRRRGRIVTAGSRMLVSARRWKKEGWLHTTARNLLVLTLYSAGVSPRRLLALYPPHRISASGAPSAGVSDAGR